MPEETHLHYDENDVYTGKTVVQRDTEWDEHSQSRALALGVFEARKCSRCGNFDTLVDFPALTRNVRWTEHAGQLVEVSQHRCTVCGALDLIQRDWNKKHEKDEARPGQALDSDGRVWAARPLEEG